MKILHINKTDTTGGAAIAARRIVESLIGEGVDAKMLVAQKKSDSPYIFSIADHFPNNLRLNFNFLGDLTFFRYYEHNKSKLFTFSPAIFGFDISEHKLVEECDIIHLHWFNQGFISTKGLSKLFKLKKPIVWTLHDMWGFTGGCHYDICCIPEDKHALREYYTPEDCMICDPYVTGDNKYSLFALKQRELKEKLMLDNPLFFPVAPSQWMQTKAENSRVLLTNKVFTINNPIDNDFYKPVDKNEALKALNLDNSKKYILFGAANVSDNRKGIKYLVDALEYMTNKTEIDNIELLIFGKMKSDFSTTLKYKIHSFDYIENPETLVNLYNAADVFVLPSLKDNLPNTVLEALSCGTPVVAFNEGGVPEMVEHLNNGYLAKLSSSEELGNGIIHILHSENIEFFRQNARKTALEKFNPKLIANKYIDLYNSILAK